MPLFTPGRRWQPPFLPSNASLLAIACFRASSMAVKGPLFGCRMCGNCLLQETAFICSMECPKGARNGPCGGSTEEHCYVDETRPCIWYQIYDRAFRMNRQEMLLEVLPPLDWDKVGGETWGDVVRQVQKVGTRQGLLRAAVTRRDGRRATDLGLRLSPGSPTRLVAGRQPVPCAQVPGACLGTGTTPEGGRVCRHSRGGAADLRQDRQDGARTSIPSSPMWRP